MGNVNPPDAEVRLVGGLIGKTPVGGLVAPGQDRKCEFESRPMIFKQ